MDTFLGLVLLAFLVGIGRRQWRHAVRVKFNEVRYDREMRKRYDL